MRTTGKRVDLTLDEARTAVERINRLMSGLDGGEQQLADLLTSIGHLAKSVDRVRSTVNVAAAVGAAIAPAVVAIIRSLGQPSAALAAENDDVKTALEATRSAGRR